jgi:glycosyltransferase involved in cell wall biosynthesis
MPRAVHFIYDNPKNPWVAGGGSVRNYEIYSRFGKEWKIDIFSGRYRNAVEHRIAQNVHQRFLGSDRDSYPVSRVQFTWNSREFLRKHAREYDLIIEDYSPFSPVCAANIVQPEKVVCQTQNYFGLPNHLRKIGPFGFFSALAERAYYHRCPNIIFSSADLKEIIVRDTKIPPLSPGYAVIPYGISDDLLAARPASRKKPQILFLGRFEIHQKGLDFLLAGFAGLQKELGNIRLLLAGSGKDRFRLENLIKKTGLEGKAVFVGRVEGREKRDLLRTSLLTVIPSRYESWGIVSVESQACGTPVLASDIPGLRQTLINGKTGILFTDSADFRRQLLRMLGNPAALKKMSGAAMHFAKKFSWDVLAGLQERYYLDTIRKYRR